jgi:hypothetical protein
MGLYNPAGAATASSFLTGAPEAAQQLMVANTEVRQGLYRENTIEKQTQQV